MREADLAFGGLELLFGALLIVIARPWAWALNGHTGRYGKPVPVRVGIVIARIAGAAFVALSVIQLVGAIRHP